MVERVQLNANNLPTRNVRAMKLKKDLIGEKGEYLVYSEEEDVAVVLTPEQYFSVYSKEPKKGSKYPSGKQREYGWIDLDSLILTALYQQDGWITNAKLAMKLNQNSKDTFHRVRKLVNTDKLVIRRGEGRATEFRINAAGKEAYKGLGGKE